MKKTGSNQRPTVFIDGVTVDPCYLQKEPKIIVRDKMKENLEVTLNQSCEEALISYTDSTGLTGLVHKLPVIPEVESESSTDSIEYDGFDLECRIHHLVSKLADVPLELRVLRTLLVYCDYECLHLEQIGDMVTEYEYVLNKTK